MTRRTSSEDRTEQAAIRLHAVVGALFRQLRRHRSTEGLTVPEMSILGRLNRFGPTTAADLAVAEQVTPQAMTRAVTSLTGQDMITKTRDVTDRRRLLLEITPTGRAAMSNTRDAGIEAIGHALDGEFSPAELDRLVAVLPMLERLRDRLSNARPSD